MNRILAYILITAIMLSLGMLVARRIGTAQPPSSFALLFTNPDGTPCKMPCMFGIRVGETSKEQALEIWRGHPVTRAFYQNRTMRGESIAELELNNGAVFFMSFTGTTQKVMTIGLRNSYGKLITLADVILALGEPDSVLPNRDNSFMTSIFYFEEQLTVEFVHPSICIHCPHTYPRLEFTVPLRFLIMGEKVHTEWATPKWLGFSRFVRYCPAICA